MDLAGLVGAQRDGAARGRSNCAGAVGATDSDSPVGGHVSVAVQIEPASGVPPEVEYRWDADTDILTANLRARAVGEGISGSIDLMGSDGAWLNLDVADGRLHGVEVAVWPDVRKVAALNPPPTVENARVSVALRAVAGNAASMSIDTALAAEADNAERTIHFRVGSARNVRTIRFGRDLLLDIDQQGRLAGLWLLNVPPFPAEQ